MSTSRPEYDQWQWRKIRLEEASRTANTEGQNTLVAVIDKGFYEDAQFKEGIDVRAHFDERGYLRNDPSPQRSHGTTCAGLVAARRGDGLVNGAAPQSRLMLVGVGDTIDTPGMANALKYCAGKGAAVITCSLGPSYGCWDDMDTLHAAIDDVYNKGREGAGTLIVWAVPNTGEEIPEDALERYPRLLCVGASDEDDNRALDSAYGEGLALLAPGVEVLALSWDPQYGRNVGPEEGASFAAPCVAGVAALVLSFRPSISMSNLAAVMTKQGCDALDGQRGWHEKFGWGRLNALKAVEAAAQLPE